MISEEPGHPVRGSLGPTRLHVVHLVAQNALESGGQFADEFLEEPGDVGLKPAGRLVSASSEEQQHVSVRGHPGGRQNPQRFSHAGAALPDQRSAQRILVQRSEEHTSELQSLMRISYAVFCLKKKKQQKYPTRP